MLIGSLKIAVLPLCVIACFAALMLAEEVIRRDRGSAPDWQRIGTNWGLGLVNWALAALVPASSLLVPIWTSTWAGPGLLTSYQSVFAYDSLDRLTTLTYPDGDHVGYTYNARNLPQSITGGPSGFIVPNIPIRLF